MRLQLGVVVYRSTYSLSLSYGAASRACGEDRESNAVRRSLRIVAQGDPLLLGRGVRRCICPGRLLAFPRPRALILFRAPGVAALSAATTTVLVLVVVAAEHALADALALARILAPLVAALAAAAAAVVVLVLVAITPHCVLVARRLLRRARAIDCSVLNFGWLSALGINSTLGST